ncbi:MAG: hypothetical protein R3B55_01755 [Candidatus Paceibacterota bacterium]
MKKLFILSLMVLVSSKTFSQYHTDIVPNEVDSNNFFYFVCLSYIVPKSSTTKFQRKVLRENAVQGNRINKAEIEMVMFPMKRYDQKFHPHIFLRVDAIPSSYLSSRFGFGLTSKPLRSSFGIFYGTYYRRVLYESNFTTRRKKSFENYNLFGLYTQSRSDHVNFSMSLAIEKTHTFLSTRVGGNIGEVLRLGKDGARLRTLETVLSYESLTGSGVGIAFSPVGGSKVEFLRVFPDIQDIIEQARLQKKLTPGFLFRVSFCVN